MLSTDSVATRSIPLLRVTSLKFPADSILTVRTVLDLGRQLRQFRLELFDICLRLAGDFVDFKHALFVVVIVVFFFGAVDELIVASVPVVDVKLLDRLLRVAASKTAVSSSCSSKFP